MTGSRGYASADRPPPVAICGLNWVGDSIMAMPALQLFHAAHPDRVLLAVVKPAMAPLWRMHPAFREIVELRPGLEGVQGAAGRLRAVGCRLAYILPNSFRSALAPFLARVTERVGFPGHARRFLLTRVVAPRNGAGRRHQAYEYSDLLMPDQPAGSLPPVMLNVPEAATRRVEAWMGAGAWVGLLPGAARGPAKQWPAGHFVEVGRWLLRTRPEIKIAILGAAPEQTLCAMVADAIGSDRVCNLAGRTSLAEWAAALRRCAVVVANDSGGMHLSAAVGTPVVALYGVTDPAKTGPLGACRILQRSANRSRAVPRDSRRAREQLAAIPPGDVEQAVADFLAVSPHPAVASGGCP